VDYLDRFFFSKYNLVQIRPVGGAFHADRQTYMT